MKNSVNNQKTSTIALILVLTISAMLVAIPTATAQTPTKMAYPYIGAVPNPAGVNQEVLLHVGVTEPIGAVDDGWEDLTVTVTDPSGHEETLGPLRTDSTGGTGTVYIPSMVGTYTLVTNFPAQEYNGVLYLDSSSNPLELIVNEDPIEYYPPTSLPSEYWSRPIDAQFREWSSIAGNWLTTGRDLPPNKLSPYNDGPETSHILWKRTLSTGGLVGGALGDHAYECGDAYEGFFDQSVIIAGVLYYNRYKAGFPTQEVVAVNLHTGEELWTKVLGDSERIAFGQNFYWDSYNYHGAFDYLWTTAGNTWNAYDALTGNWVYGITGMPSGTSIYGPKGEIYVYSIDLANGWLTLWNSSRLISDSGSWMGSFGATGSYVMHNASAGIEWNKTITTGLQASVTVVLNDRIIGMTTDTFRQSFAGSPVSLWAISLESGNEGELLFNESWARPTGNLTMVYKGASLEEGIFIISAKENTNHYAFSIDDGELVWSTTESQYYLDSLDYWTSTSMHTALAYGKFISVGTGGIVYAYNTATGTLEWTYAANDYYSEILWSNNWPLHIAFITDGKIYLTHDEHSPIDPKPRGAPFICLDMETGNEVWRIDGAFRGTYWGGRAIIGDSIIATMNTYDQQIYAIGKGPTVTSVEAPMTAVTQGSSVIIRGTVLDVSPGTNAADLTLRFPNGVAAVSEDSMNDWMKYVYQQAPIPADATGVTVKLEAIDPNGEYQFLGTTTSDMSGFYSFMFEPELEGKYTIIATFEASKAYYGSYAETALGVDAPAAATPIEPDQTPDETPDQTPDTEAPDTETPATEAPLISTEVAIIAAVAVACVVSVAAFFALRKRK